MSTTDNYLNINKVGDSFSVTSKLAEYVINPDWKNGFDAIINPNVNSQNTTIWNTISTSCEDIGAEIYKKISNYIDNIGNIDTCELHSLYSFAKLYGYNNSLLFLDFTFPNEILDLINIFSLNKAYLTGANSLLTYSSRLKVEALSGSDSDYLQYVNDIFYNTLDSFVNLKYRDYELSPDVSYDGTIWKKDVNRYTNELFKDDLGSSNDILLKKVSLNVPIYFTERIYVNDIQAGIRKITDFSSSEQVILNMELDRRAEARDKLKNISKYSYERENKVLTYFRFIILFIDSGYSVQEYNLDTKKNLIISNSDALSELLIYNSTTREYEVNYSLISQAAQKLVDLCIRISYIRENMKNQAQKYYMSGTENLLINFIRETLFTTLYNNTESSSAYWRYSNNATNLLNSNISSNDDLKIDVINYIDPVEYFNIATVSELSAVGTSGINARYWEGEYSDLYDSDITEQELLDFYSKLGLDNRFTGSYSSSSITASSFSLSSFLSTVFDSGATSATSSILYPQTTITVTTSTTPITSETNIVPISGFTSVAYGTKLDGSNIYVATNSSSGIYTSVNGVNWNKITAPYETGWTSVAYGSNTSIFIATNIIYGIYWSLDGITWTKENTTAVDSGWTCVTYGDSNYRYCATNSLNGIYWSLDGITWTKFADTGITAGWNSVAFNTYTGNYYIATNSIHGPYYSASCSSWTAIDNPPGNSNWINVESGPSTGIYFTAINSTSGLFYTNNTISTFTRSPISSAGIDTTWVDLTYGDSKYVASNSISGLYYSVDNGANWIKNNSVVSSGWSTLDYENGYFLGQNSLSGFCYSTTGSGEWYSTSGLTVTGGGQTISTSASSTVGGDVIEGEIFRKYSGISTLGETPFANIKNTLHSSYQVHPYLKAFKQYVEAVRSINNLFSYTVPDLTTCFSTLLSRLDEYGNTINFWYNNPDFTGYSSLYELEDAKGNNPNLYQDSPFNFNALREYLNDKDTFISACITGEYYNTLDLTQTEISKILTQLDLYYNNIKELEKYSIYKYGRDTFGNIYVLYKKNNVVDEKGQLWIRFKNHPIAFPAFILDTNTSLLSDVSQIPYSNINTLLTSIDNSTNIDQLGPLSGKMSFDNITFTSTAISSLSGTPNSVQTTIVSLIDNVDVMFTDLTRTSFYTTNISDNAELSEYFSIELSGVLTDGYVTISPRTSSSSISSTDYYNIFNSGNINIFNDYVDVTIECNNNIFSYETTLQYNDSLNLFFDFGFNYNKDMLYIDYSTSPISPNAYIYSNTLFGEIYNTTTTLDRTIQLNYNKYALHNLETLPQDLLNNFEHIGTIINEKDIYFVYKHSVILEVSSTEYSLKLYIFKYNKTAGLSYRFYSVPIKYNVYGSDAFKVTCSNSLLSIAYSSELPKGTDNISNYVSGYETTQGGKTSFENVIDTSYLNGIGIIQFKLDNELPLTYDNVKYFCKHTDCGFFPQYPGLNGINYFYRNNVIKNNSFYRIQLYVVPSSPVDFIYEQTFLDTVPPVSGAYEDMLSIDPAIISPIYDDIYLQANRERYIYDSESYPTSTADLSTYPYKWFRKYDLSGSDLSIFSTSAGYDLSNTRLTPSAYNYHSKEEAYSNLLSATYFPQLSAIGINEDQYCLFELDAGYTIMAKSEANGDIVTNITFEKINNNNQVITLNSVFSPIVTFNYDYTTGIKSYRITLVNLQKKQFIIERI